MLRLKIGLNLLQPYDIFSANLSYEYVSKIFYLITPGHENDTADYSQLYVKDGIAPEYLTDFVQPAKTIIELF